MVELTDIRSSLVSQLGKQNELPCHVSAFSGWVTSDESSLRESAKKATGYTGQARHPEHVAALGYAAAARLLNSSEVDLLRDEISHLSGRAFFASGRPLRFEVDGLALLGVALGVAILDYGSEAQWLIDLLKKSAHEVMDDPWHTGLIRSALLSLGEENLRIAPPDLAVAMHEKQIGELRDGDLQAGWELASSLKPHNDGLARDAARLTVFDHVLLRFGQVAIAANTREDLILLLKNVSRSMRHWRFEPKPRTPKSALTRWEIENEYHVQSLLWAVLAPVFSDLEDEENLPSVGHKNPRADLGIPSLKTIIEVKFMRHSGQAACAKIIEEIAADASLYLSKQTTYDNIIAFVWDDCAQTEQHYELQSGLESIRGISAAIILPRPSSMVRS